MKTGEIISQIPYAQETIGLGVKAGQKIGAGINRFLISPANSAHVDNEDSPSEMFYTELPESLDQNGTKQKQRNRKTSTQRDKEPRRFRFNFIDRLMRREAPQSEGEQESDEEQKVHR